MGRVTTRKASPNEIARFEKRAHMEKGLWQMEATQSWLAKEQARAVQEAAARQKMLAGFSSVRIDEYELKARRIR